MKQLSEFDDAHLRIFDRPRVPPASEISDVYLIGICGTGMGSLAGLFKSAGFTVSGSDRAAYPPMSDRLREMGVRVLEGYDPAHLDPPPDLVIVGNACIPTHSEAAYAREHGLVQQSLPEALAHFFIRDRRSLVMAGTHGKTTTTGLLAHVFRHAGRDPGFLVGGVMANGNTSYALGTGPHFIVEGDEYDSAYFDKRPKFMHYRPHIAVVTSVEFDHADIFDDPEDYRRAFGAFVETVDEKGLLLLCDTDDHVTDLATHSPAEVWTYGCNRASTVHAVNARYDDCEQAFDLRLHDQPMGRMPLPMPGRHNLLNTLAVCGTALREGISVDDLRAALATFKGLKRRMEIRGTVGGTTVVDDFAHHPTAVRETIAAARSRWPNRRIVAVFEPRSNSSRRKVFESAYGSAFEQADRVYLSTPPLRHNDDEADFMDVQHIALRLKHGGTYVGVEKNADALLPVLLADIRPGDIVLIMSNGGFDNIHQRLLDALSQRNEV